MMDQMKLCCRESTSSNSAREKSLCNFIRFKKSRVGSLQPESENRAVESPNQVASRKHKSVHLHLSDPAVPARRKTVPNNEFQHSNQSNKKNLSIQQKLCTTMTERSQTTDIPLNRCKDELTKKYSNRRLKEDHNPVMTDVGLQVEEQLLSGGDTISCNGGNSLSLNKTKATAVRGCPENLVSQFSPKKVAISEPSKGKPNCEKVVLFADETSTSDTGNDSTAQTPEHCPSFQDDCVDCAHEDHNIHGIAKGVRQRLLIQCHSADNLFASSGNSSPASTRSVPEAPPRRKKKSTPHDIKTGVRGRPLSVGCDSQLGQSNRSHASNSSCSAAHTGQFSASTENLARQSLLAAQLLHLIPAHKARERNYLHGRIAANSLLGSVELERVLPSRMVQIFVGTWNMNGQAPPTELNDLLLPEELEHVPDIMVFGTQESYPEKFEWEVGIQETIGPSHVLLHSSALGTLHLALYVRRDLIWFCSVPEEASFSVRPGTAFRTKGAVAIAFMLFGTSFLFVTSHLTAHAEKVKERLSDVKRIVRALDLPKNLPYRHKNKDVTQNFDCVFWCGDLNFRLSQPREQVVEWVEQQQFPLLAPHKMDMDQLTNSISDGAVFRGFEEGPITFRPTYKYDPGTQMFDTSQKQRTPSYTDRILYKCRHAPRRASSILGSLPMTAPNGAKFLECLKYSSVQSVCTSDHKPVWGLFRSHIRPGIDTIPLAAGLFNRDVYLEGIRRRAAAMDKRDGSSAVCSLQ